jgi:hypothetical protein
MNRRNLGGALVGIAVLTSACLGGASSSPTATTAPSSGAASVSGDGSPSAGASGTPVEVPSLSAAPSAEPSEDALPAFACDYPLVSDGTVPRAQLTDVRVGTHGDYDRIVFEYQDGLPELEVAQATPPLLADASGMELDVAGNAFLRITLRGGTKQTNAGGSSYPGPTEFTPGFDRLVEMEEGGDFEAVNTWYVGMSGDACIRGFTLSDPPRIVIDLEH